MLGMRHKMERSDLLRLLVALLVALLIVSGIFLYIEHSKAVNGIPAYVPTNDYTRGVKFDATITADQCIAPGRPVGDVGCSLELDHTLTISVAHGNVLQTLPEGAVINFPAYPADPTGKRVEVYAHQVGPKEYTLAGSTGYYVKIID